MGTIKTKGIILSENNLGDYDKMLTILTPGMGKISCVAKGARRPKSLLLAGTQFLCFGDYVLYEGTSTYHMNSCETIEVFYKLRMDLDKLEAATEVTKLVKEVTTENENTYRILQLFLNTLYMISETEENKEWIGSVFKLRLTYILGYTPNVIECTSCKEKEKLVYFSMKDNGLKCQNCGKLDTSSISIAQATELALKYIMMAPPKKLFSFHMTEEGIKELQLISQLYVKKILEI